MLITLLLDSGNGNVSVPEGAGLVTFYIMGGGDVGGAGAFKEGGFGASVVND